tara:strand:+ start:125 stop:319 length:195 start_codon:yes stop_codon:yes gene_type:complete
MYDLNNPPSSPFDTSAAIPIMVRPYQGMGEEAPPKAEKQLHKAFWPALAGVVGLVWFFNRTDKN